MLQPGAEKEGVGLGVLRMIKPWHEWMLMWGYEAAAGPPEITDEFARELAVQLVGTDDFEMRVTSRLPWTVNHHFATTIASGRVFCVGDAVHRHPPTNGLGSNTSIQDSYNLAWKLHAVLRGWAAPSLLETYNAERAPVARQIVERANQSIADTGRIVAALDVDDTSDVAKLNRQLALRVAPGPEGEKIRENLREAIAYKAYEFDAHGVEHNHRYASSAVVPDGTAMPAFTRDPELYAQPTTWPGAKLPHTWVTRAGHRVSTLDLAGHGAFSIWTGIGGQAWLDAAAAFSGRTGLPITGVSIGPREPIEDPYGTWAELREISDGGVLLVRPDLYVAARHASAPDSPEAAAAWLDPHPRLRSRHRRAGLAGARQPQDAAGSVVQARERGQHQVGLAVARVRGQERVRDGEAAHSGRLGCPHAIRGVLDGKASRRALAQPARRGEVDVGSWLAGGLIGCGAAHLDVLQPEPVADGVNQPSRRRRGDREPKAQPAEPAERLRHPGHRHALRVHPGDDETGNAIDNAGVAQRIQLAAPAGLTLPPDRD